MSTLNTVATLASDFAALRAASPSDWQSTLVALLARRGAPMLLLDSSELEALGELRRFDEDQSSGGASGSPVLNIKGQAIALNAGGSNHACTHRAPQPYPARAPPLA